MRRPSTLTSFAATCAASACRQPAHVCAVRPRRLFGDHTVDALLSLCARAAAAPPPHVAAAADVGGDSCSSSCACATRTSSRPITRWGAWTVPTHLRLNLDLDMLEAVRLSDLTTFEDERPSLRSHIAALKRSFNLIERRMWYAVRGGRTPDGEAHGGLWNPRITLHVSQFSAWPPLEWCTVEWLEKKVIY